MRLFLHVTSYKFHPNQYVTNRRLLALYLRYPAGSACALIQTGDLPIYFSNSAVQEVFDTGSIDTWRETGPLNSSSQVRSWCLWPHGALTYINPSELYLLQYMDRSASYVFLHRLSGATGGLNALPRQVLRRSRRSFTWCEIRIQGVISCLHQARSACWNLSYP